MGVAGMSEHHRGWREAPRTKSRLHERREVWEPQDRRLERQEPLTTPGPQDIHKLLSTALGVLKVP